MRVRVDRKLCVGAGQCVMASPAVFDQRDEDGTSLVLLEEAPEPLQESAREAARLCPA